MQANARGTSAYKYICYSGLNGKKSSDLIKNIYSLFTRPLQYSDSKNLLYLIAQPSCMSAIHPSIDVILISDARTKKLRELTSRAISSAGENVNIIVVESNKSVRYRYAHVIHPSQPFNYNAYLNLGAQQGHGEYILFANNDVLFDMDWANNIVQAMVQHQVVSASPICPRVAAALDITLHGEVLFGYDLITRFCGWAFMWTRKFYDLAGGLDESFKFWCSDNAAVEQLKKHQQQHMLVPSSLVMHINDGHNTLALLDKKTAMAYTTEEVEKFNRLFHTNLWEAAHLKRNG